MKKYLVLPGLTVIAGLAMGAAALAHAQVVAGSTISSSLDIGQSGSDVITLQSLLATDPSIYPSGLVTGYYGQLTSDAVTQFQIDEGLPPVGRVGPLTLAKLNSILAMGTPTIDFSAPVIENATVAQSATSATVTWATNEPARGTVYFATAPLTEQESSTPMEAPTISGSAVTESSFGVSHSVILNSLTPGTLYYYIVQSTDAAGNVSVALPATFTTSQ